MDRVYICIDLKSFYRSTQSIMIYYTDIGQMQMPPGFRYAKIAAQGRPRHEKLYLEYILKRTESFYSSEIRSNNTDSQERSQPTATYIQNNYYTVNNNFFNPTNAVEALVDFKRVVESQQTVFIAR